MTARRKFLLLSVASAACPRMALAQTKMPTVGFLWIEPAPYRKMLIDALRERGHIENQNIRFLDRTVKEGYGQITNNARELVQAKVDVIAAYGATSTNAVAKITKDIPIVMVTGADPVAAGHAASLARPGGNVTGVTTVNSSHLSRKRVELLKDLAPGLTRVGLLVAVESAVAANIRSETDAAVRHFKLQTHVAEVHTPSDLEQAFDDLSRARVGAVIVASSTMLFGQAERIVALAAKYRLPSVYASKLFTDAGGLMSYNADFGDQVRRSATYIDRILKGARPGDLPIEQPTKFELIVNMKTAKTLGITIPSSILARADRVIE